jgi:aryl-alcohol dehydrogenase-like predicted oxidoreductase
LLLLLLNGHAGMTLKLSSLGLGTYLGAADDATDEQVLAAVLYSATRGWNVIDTGALAGHCCSSSTSSSSSSREHGQRTAVVAVVFALVARVARDAFRTSIEQQ